MSAPGDLFHFSVTQAHDGVGDRGGFRAVSGHDSCGVLFTREPLQQFEDRRCLSRCRDFPLARRPEEWRVIDESASDGDALHLAAGELVGIAVAQAIELNPMELLSADARAFVFPARSSGSSTFSKTVRV